MIYYSLDQRTYGPVTVPDLHALYQAGRIRPETPVRRSTSQKWRPYLAEFRASAPAPDQFAALPPAGIPLNESYTRHTAPALSAQRLITTAWILLGTALAIACIPLLGMVVWFAAGTIALTVFILSVIILINGRTGHGVALLVCDIFVFPVLIVIAPLISSLSAAAVASDLPPSGPAPAAGARTPGSPFP